MIRRAFSTTTVFLIFCSALIHGARLEFAFTLDTDGYVTLVLDDSAGNRVKNLISETFLEQGDHIVFWDLDSDTAGFDNRLLGVPSESMPAPVPGTYRVRGLIRDEIDLRYQLTPYNPGTPPWETVDGSGQWMADHTPPAGAVFVPDLQEVILTSDVSESSAGVIWVNMDMRKTFEFDNLSSGWRCPGALTHDRRTGRVFGVMSGNPMELWELTGKEATRLKKLAKNSTRGIAADDDLLVVSIKKDSALILFDVSGQTRIIDTVALPEPKGCIFDKQGRLLVISEDRLLRGVIDSAGLRDVDTLARDITGASTITVDDSTGYSFVSRHDTCNTIVVFDSTGVLVRTIGTPGPEQTGPYDSTHMVRPNGMAIDSKRRLWVSESNYIPKRVSVWTLEGELIKQFFGPTKYGGGGVLDPADTTRFYYAEDYSRGSFEMKLDWDAGTATVVRLLERWSGHSPQAPWIVDGRRYHTDESWGYPTKLRPRIHVQIIDNDTARTLAIVGKPPEDSLLATDAFASLWNPDAAHDYVFIWSDLNYNAIVDPAEAHFFKQSDIGVKTTATNKNFEFTIQTSKGVYRLPLSHFTDDNVPVWLPDSMELVTERTGQAFRTCDGATLIKANPMWGKTAEGAEWTYLNKWPGVRESWRNPYPPRYFGEMIGVTKFLYSSFTPRESDIGEIFPLNGNMGSIYLMSSDGLFVASLLKHIYVGAAGWPLHPHRGSGRGGWHMPEATRGMLLNDVSGGEEQWFPSITQTENGSVYLVAGHEHNSIIRLEGLESIQRITLGEVTVSEQDLSTGAMYELDLTYNTPSSARTIAQGRHRPRVMVAGRKLIVAKPGGLNAIVAVYRADGKRVAVRRISNVTGRGVLSFEQLSGGTYYYTIKQKGNGRRNTGMFAIIP